MSNKSSADQELHGGSATTTESRTSPATGATPVAIAGGSGTTATVRVKGDCPRRDPGRAGCAANQQWKCGRRDRGCAGRAGRAAHHHWHLPANLIVGDCSAPTLVALLTIARRECAPQLPPRHTPPSLRLALPPSLRLALPPSRRLALPPSRRLTLPPHHRRNGLRRG